MSLGRGGVLDQLGAAEVDDLAAEDLDLDAKDGAAAVALGAQGDVIAVLDFAREGDAAEGEAGVGAGGEAEAEGADLGDGGILARVALDVDQLGLGDEEARQRATALREPKTVAPVRRAITGTSSAWSKWVWPTMMASACGVMRAISARLGSSGRRRASRKLARVMYGSIRIEVPAAL